MKMRVNYAALGIALVLAAVFIALLAIRVPAPVGALAEQPPVLDAIDREILDLAYEAHVNSQTAIEMLPEVKHARKLKAVMDKLVVVKYPGYMLDWQATSASTVLKRRQ